MVSFSPGGNPWDLFFPGGDRGVSFSQVEDLFRQVGISFSPHWGHFGVIMPPLMYQSINASMYVTLEGEVILEVILEACSSASSDAPGHHQSQSAHPHI